MQIKQLFQKYFMYYLIFVLGVFFSVNKLGILARFPWQDLLYADFQIYNRWRWFAESINQTGFFDTLTSSIDFRMNTGENIFLSSRVSNPIFDIGAWMYKITGNIDISFVFKYVTYATFCFFGCLSLLQIRNYSKNTANAYRKLSLFAIIFVSIISHPVLFHEVGPMVFWYLMLTPCWINILLRVADYGFKLGIKDKWLPILVILTIGSSDLFIYFYFVALTLTVALLKEKNVQTYKNLFYMFISVELILIFNKIPYFFFTIDKSNVAKSGTIPLNTYMETFVVPLLKHSLLLPWFTGPVNIFINIIVVVFLLYQFLVNKRILKRLSLIALVILLFELAIGMILHSFSIFTSNLPSAFRYHIAIFPFIVFCLLFFLNESHLNKINLDLKENVSTSVGINRKFILVLLLVTLTANVNTIYSPIIASSSKHVINFELRKWLVTDLPGCINANIAKIDNQGVRRSFIFSTNAYEAGRNDALTALIENPEALKGRTFQQWRYSTAKSASSFNIKSGLNAFNSWALTNDDLNNIVLFSDRSSSPFLISTDEIYNSAMKFVGKCRPPKPLLGSSLPFISRASNIPIGNESLESSLYLYEIRNQEAIQPVILSAKYYSNIAEYTVKSQVSNITLPINFSPSLRIFINGHKVPVTADLDNLSVVENRFDGKKNLQVRVTSFSLLILSDLTVLIFLLFYSFIFWIRLIKLKSSTNIKRKSF